MDSSNSLSPASFRYMDLFRFREFHLCSTGPNSSWILRSGHTLFKAAMKTVGQKLKLPKILKPAYRSIIFVLSAADDLFISCLTS